MALEPDGRIIVAGSIVVSGVPYVALARYGTNGTLDSSFGIGGKVTMQAGQYATSLALQPGGKILVAGVAELSGTNQYAVFRYNEDGSLDDSFGIGGEVLVSFNDEGNDLGEALALDQIGRPVIVGNANNLFGVARLESEPFLKFTSIQSLTNRQVMLRGLGVPVASHTLHASPNLSFGGFSPLDSVMTDGGGFWQYLDTNAAGVNRRVYRLSYP
jgi:uncharacterized delta-60 repeat protein